MIKAVIDTNVLISGMYGKSGPPREILYLLKQGKIDAVITLEIFAEFERVSGYKKFKFSDGLREDTLSFMRKSIAEDPFVNYPISGIPGDDLKFVHAALQYDANYLITGN
jgi:putative PIN family toxin of toxin-antitoxin system